MIMASGAPVRVSYTRRWWWWRWWNWLGWRHGRNKEANEILYDAEKSLLLDAAAAHEALIFFFFFCVSSRF